MKNRNLYTSLFPQFTEDQRKFESEWEHTYWVCWNNILDGVTLGIDLEDESGRYDNLSLKGLETEYKGREYVPIYKQRDIALMDEVDYECDKQRVVKEEWEKLFLYYSKSYMFG